MKYTMTSPCHECPFLKSMTHGFTKKKLEQFACGEFPCHKTADGSSGIFTTTNKSIHCAGALIFNEKRNTPHQMMRICERLGLYDRNKLNMEAEIV